MILLDDILLAPFKGLLWVFKEIHQRAQDEVKAQKDQLQSQLSDLYMQLDAGRISEQEFDARQKGILDELQRTERLEAETEGRARAEHQEQR